MVFKPVKSSSDNGGSRSETGALNLAKYLAILSSVAQDPIASKYFFLRCRVPVRILARQRLVVCFRFPVGR